jgi:hypothetical protein
MVQSPPCEADSLKKLVQCLAHLILLDFMTVIFSEQYKLCGSSLFNLLPFLLLPPSMVQIFSSAIADFDLCSLLRVRQSTPEVPKLYGSSPL